jgi:hypothetical protein
MFAFACFAALAATALHASPGDDAARLAAEVERAAAEVAARQVAPPDRFEVLSVRFGGADPAPPGAIELEPLDVDGPSETGTVRVEQRLMDDGTP